MKRLIRRIKRGFRRGDFWGVASSITILCAVFGVPALLFYTIYLDQEIRARFEGQRWEVPSRVYARPMELYTGKVLRTEALEQELDALRYRRVPEVGSEGTYERRGREFRIHLRPFEFHDENRLPRIISLSIQNNEITNLIDWQSKQRLELVRLEPIFIGGIYPAKNQDRILIRYQDAPELLIKTLLAVEDRSFFEHNGIVPQAILRALMANIRAGRRVQGGSTLTQQLVKNFFLTQEKSLWRKFNEAIMALLLEWHYSKEEILEAYMNEIYLGQDGKRAIHGFGLASQFYFEKPLEALDVGEMAFLVGVVKGPSRYEPRRSPVLAQQRRNVVLRVLLEENMIDEQQMTQEMESPVGVTRYRPNGVSPYPGFLELVKRQLKSEYRDEDLSGSGFRIFTTLDPQVQQEAESVVAVQLLKLELFHDIELDSLQAGVVLSDVHSGEVAAIVGDRESRFAGFNRALDAARPIGSLVKPAVYLTALERPEKYHLGSLIEDSPLDLSATPWADWQPTNYDNAYHGKVPLFLALARSFNVATVRLGLDLGLESVIETLGRLGIEQEIEPLPSMLLGALELTPYQVSQMYQTIAAGGFSSSLRAIRAVTRADGSLLQRYPLEGKQRVSPESAYLLNLALQNVVESGTARGLQYMMPDGLKIAGKTGTTNEKRDSWFAGFTGNRLGVVWIGSDINDPMGLSGSTGAMRVWGEIFSKIDNQSIQAVVPEQIEFVYIDPVTGAPSRKRCGSAIEIPVIAGHGPQGKRTCSR